MATAGQPTSDGSSSSAGGGQGDSSEQLRGNFECNICFDTAKDAVVSMCGHLFCWPCIFRWMEAKGARATCPVCKSVLDKEKLIPLYGRGNTSGSDPRDTAPPRPQGQREDPPPNQGDQQWGFQDGIQFSFGIGAFPFMMFGGPFFQMFGLNPPVNVPGRPQPTRQEMILSRVMMIIALFLILWLFLS